MQKKAQKFFAKVYLAVLGLLLIGLPGQAGASVQSGLLPLGPSFPGAINQSRDVNSLIAFVIEWILLYIAGPLAVLFLIIGGFWYITSGGNEEQAEKGKKTIFNALIGIVIVVLSYVIVSVIVNLVSS